MSVAGDVCSRERLFFEAQAVSYHLNLAKAPEQKRTSERTSHGF